MQAGSIAACLDDYFLHSEQLPTRLRLHCDADGCNGLLLQRLPLTVADQGAAGNVDSLWRQCTVALDALPAPSLGAATAELLPAVVGEHDCRLLDATAVVCRCSCSRERVSEVLRSLGAREAHAILAEQGQVAITCEFCGRSWDFDAIAVERLFTAGLPAADGRRLN
jgi:molecular chaperone Hsp33